MPKRVKQVLDDLKSGLGKIYQKRLRQLLLYGSYARGEAKEDSDIDVAMIVDDYADIGKEIEATGQLVSTLSLNNNLVISLHPIKDKDWQTLKIPFLLNLKKEAIAI